MFLLLHVPWAGLQCEIVVFPGHTRNRSALLCKLQWTLTVNYFTIFNAIADLF